MVMHFSATAILKYRGMTMLPFRCEMIGCLFDMDWTISVGLIPAGAGVFLRHEQPDDGVRRYKIN